MASEDIPDRADITVCFKRDHTRHSRCIRIFRMSPARHIQRTRWYLPVHKQRVYPITSSFSSYSRPISAFYWRIHLGCTHRVPGNSKTLSHIPCIPDVPGYPAYPHTRRTRRIRVIRTGDTQHTRHTQVFYSHTSRIPLRYLTYSHPTRILGMSG